jgi:hypothetical protein
MPVFRHIRFAYAMELKTFKEELIMRNILMTVMLLIVVVVMFSTVIMTPSTGTKAVIENKGSSVNTGIGGLLTPP